MYRIILLIFLIYVSSLRAHGITLVTLAAGDEYRKAVELGIENKRVYCQLHGYNFICEEKWLDPSRPHSWSKIPLILKEMENPDVKWIFWCDADALIMNLATSLENLIDENYNFILAKTSAPLIEAYDIINGGQFLIKNCEWSRSFLKDVYDRKECIFHPWWEQQAIILELEEKPELNSYTKFLPQRLLSPYPIETHGEFLKVTYQPGDFIIHITAIRNLNDLRAFFEHYSKKVINDPNLPTLDQYLGIYGYKLTPMDSKTSEGYITASQQKEYIQQLQLNPKIKSIVEVGLSAGHSAEVFFQTCPHVQKYIAFDKTLNPYTKVAAEYLSNKYQDRFEFIQGNPLHTIPEYLSIYPTEKADLIHLSANFSYDDCLLNILNLQNMAHPGTILWINFCYGSFLQAIKACETMGIIKIINVYQSKEPNEECYWIEACYI